MQGQAFQETAEWALSFWRCPVSACYCFRVWILVAVCSCMRTGKLTFPKSDDEDVVNDELRDHLSVEPLTFTPLPWPFNVS